MYIICRWSQWPRHLRRRSTAARLLRLWIRIPPGAWMFVCCVLLSGRDLCDELITRPEESYRLWCVVVCDLETSWIRRPWRTGGCRAKNRQTSNLICYRNAKFQFYTHIIRNPCQVIFLAAPKVVSLNVVVPTYCLHTQQVLLISNTIEFSVHFLVASLRPVL